MRKAVLKNWLYFCPIGKNSTETKPEREKQAETIVFFGRTHEVASQKISDPDHEDGSGQSPDLLRISLPTSRQPEVVVHPSDNLARLRDASLFWFCRFSHDLMCKGDGQLTESECFSEESITGHR
jgi:hypothetical protein